MALPHYSEDQTSRKGKNFEPVQANLFEVTILPPDGVSGQALFLQHIPPPDAGARSALARPLG